METVISNTKVSVTEFRKMLFDDDDDYYYEIINGEMIQKSAPTSMHQRISRRLVVILDKFVTENKSGEIFQSPTDVYLDEYNKPQPDLVFVSNQKKDVVTNDGIIGTPDLIIEIVSPTSIIRDRIEKKNLYERYGGRRVLAGRSSKYCDRNLYAQKQQLRIVQHSNNI
jgi:Uma2 family endonuclease